MKDTLLYIIPILFFTCNNREQDKYLEKIETAKEEVVHFDNPAIFIGCSFGEFFQMLHKTGKYDDMLKYTSTSTRITFSNEQLLDFYKNMKFSFPLKKLKAMIDSSDCKVLLYTTSIDATIKTIQLKVIIENDTCRVVFESLNDRAPFVGI